MPQILIEDSGNLNHPKNVKSIINTTVSHLISCQPPWMGEKKRCSEKYMILEISIKSLKKYLKSNCIKSELVQKNFSSIFLKLPVTSLNSQEIVRTTAFQSIS